MRISLLLAMAIGASFIGSSCGGSNVGDPCTPEDEYLTSFNGFSKNEVNVESRSFQCLTRVCLVNHFQGRVSCPYGQEEDPSAKGSGLATCMGTTENRNSTDCLPGKPLHEKSCQVPDRDGSRWEDRIAVPVDEQLQERQAVDTVYCSCRCAGDGDQKTLCDCPNNYDCKPLVEDLGQGKGQLAGSYCIKEGTLFDPGGITKPCSPSSLEGHCSDEFDYTLGKDTKARNQDSTACLPAGASCKPEQTCCAEPVIQKCIDNEVSGEERNCNGICTGESTCQHLDPHDPTVMDPSRVETIYAVPTYPCKDKVCNGG